MTTDYSDRSMYEDNAELNSRWQSWRAAQAELLDMEQQCDEAIAHMALRPRATSLATLDEILAMLGRREAMFQHYIDLDRSYTHEREAYVRSWYLLA